MIAEGRSELLMYWVLLCICLKWCIQCLDKMHKHKETLCKHIVYHIFYSSIISQFCTTPCTYVLFLKIWTWRQNFCVDVLKSKQTPHPTKYGMPPAHNKALTFQVNGELVAPYVPFSQSVCQNCRERRRHFMYNNMESMKYTMLM